jgi:hypothetical protein
MHPNPNPPFVCQNTAGSDSVKCAAIAMSMRLVFYGSVVILQGRQGE